MILCFDIGGSAIKSARAFAPDDIRPLSRVPTPLDDFDVFVSALSGLIAEADAPEGSGIAISITGVVDPDTGRIKCANIPCVDGRTLSADLVGASGPAGAHRQ